MAAINLFDFLEKSNKFFDGLCLLSLKSLGFSLTENTLQMGVKKRGQKQQKHKNPT